MKHTLTLALLLALGCSVDIRVPLCVETHGLSTCPEACVADRCARFCEGEADCKPNECCIPIEDGDQPRQACAPAEYCWYE